MLIMKAWMETRWRLTALAVYLLAALAFNYRSNHAPTANPRGMLIMLWMLLTTFVISLGGSGVKSQSPAGFPEGLAGSTQFTIALPVTRRRLLAVRAAFGLLESFAVTIIIAVLTWSLFPSVRATIAPLDFTRAVAATLVFLTVPYCANVFFTTIVDEPLSLMYAGWSVMLILWLLHRIAPPIDIFRAFTQSSPLVTHTFPWPQIATAFLLAALTLYLTSRLIQSREY
jgi:hypothetical protein